jgi:hypothetical protein
MKRRHIVPLVALACATWAAPVQAQEAPSDGWTIRLTPYLWATAFNGDATVKGQKADVDVSFGDVLSNLDGALLGQIEATKGPWSLVAQGNFLRASIDGSVDQFDTDVDANAVIGELFGAYRLAHWPLGSTEAGSVRPMGIEHGLTLDGLAGFMYTHLDADLEVKGNGLERHFSANQQWATPFVGLRTLVGLNEHWFLAAVGYAGAVSSDNTVWNLQGLVGYAFNESISVEAGYRALYQNYENGNGNDRFHYDVITHGPVIGVTFVW